MLDRREQALVDTLTALKTVSGVKKDRVLRNETSVTAKLGPWLILYDNDEVVVRNKPGDSPRIVEMQPVVKIVLEAPAATVGTKLNKLLLDVKKKITASTALASTVGPNGAVAYEGCQTSITGGEQKEGQMDVNFTIAYPQLPPEL